MRRFKTVTLEKNPDANMALTIDYLLYNTLHIVNHLV